jgi:thiosulfate reductase cytochrome b subunit
VFAQEYSTASCASRDDLQVHVAAVQPDTDLKQCAEFRLSADVGVTVSRTMSMSGCLIYFGTTWKIVFCQPLRLPFSLRLPFYIDASLSSLHGIHFLFIWLFQGLDQKPVSRTIFYADD